MKDKFIVVIQNKYHVSFVMYDPIANAWYEVQHIHIAFCFETKEQAIEIFRKEYWAGEVDWYVLQVAAHFNPI